jgi:hypothetical protein
MRSAVVKINDNIVINVIMANPAVDPCPAGYILVLLAADSSVSKGWIYNPSTGQFTEPTE